MQRDVDRPRSSRDQTVGSVMTAHAVFVDARAEVSAADQVLRSRGGDWLLVMDDSVLVSVVSGTDLAGASSDDRVSALGKASFLVAYVDDPISGVAERMLGRGIACVPVLDDRGQIVGILTRADLRRARLLPGERGMDLCASCGSDEHLEQSCTERGRAFCVDCLSGLPSPIGEDAGYATLGGSG